MKSINSIVNLFKKKEEVGERLTGSDKVTSIKLTDSILNYFQKKEKGDETLKAPEGICVPCWGYQEFDNEFREIIKDKQIEVNAGRENYNFIENIVVNKIEGIHLKNTIKGLECLKCKTIHS